MGFKGYDMLDDGERALVDSALPHARMQAALDGLAPEVLIKDSDPRVIAALGATGYPMVRLAADADPDVRALCARYGYALDVLTEDGDLDVRAAAWKALEKADLTLREWIIRNPKHCFCLHEDASDEGLQQTRKPRIEEITHDAQIRAKERNAHRHGRRQIKAIAQRAR